MDAGVDILLFCETVGVKRKGYKAWLTQWAMAMAMARGVVSLKALSHRVIRR